MQSIAKTLASCVLLLVVDSAPPAWAGWCVDGVPLCTAQRDQVGVSMASDGNGGAIVGWVDDDGGGFNYIYVQRIDQLGNPVWTTNGVEIGFAGMGRDLHVASDGAGGAIMAWGLSAGYLDVYAQRVNTAGDPQWEEGGVIVTETTGNHYHPQIISDGSGGAIIVWQYSYPDEFNTILIAERMNASGEYQWSAVSVSVYSCINAIQHCMIPDEAGGAIVAWDCNGDIRAQRLNTSGETLWTAPGIGICTVAGWQYIPAIASDGAGGAIVIWKDDRDEDLIYDIYAQRVNASGAAQWTANGITVCSATADLQWPVITSDGAGGAIITWQDGRAGDANIYAQRLNAAGDTLWDANGVPVCSAAGNQEYPVIISDEAHGAIVTWMDKRSGGYDIYAQKIDSSGIALWAPGGVALCTAVNDQENPDISADGAGGAIVSWNDMRTGGCDVYAQRVCEGVAPVATLLRSSSAVCVGPEIKIDWALSSIDEGVEFVIARTVESPIEFKDIPSASIERNGLSFLFEDWDIDPGTTYRYRVDMRPPAGRKTLFETGPITTPAAALALFQNQPNPFNPSTTIRYCLPERTAVRLEVYDSSGAKVATLADGVQEKGAHVVSWDGRDKSDRTVTSGIYFYSLRAGKEVVTRKMVLLR